MNSNFASQSKLKLFILKQFHQEPQVNIKELWNYVKRFLVLLSHAGTRNV